METVPLEAERKSGRRHAQGGKTLMPSKLEQISDKGNGGHLSCLLHRRRVGVPVPSPKKEKDIRKGDEADCCWRSDRPTWLSVSCFHYTRVDWRWRMGIGITYLDVPRKNVSSLSRLFLMEHYRDGK